MEMLRKQQLHELPTIMDEQKKMEERITKEMKVLGEVRAGPRGASTGSAGGKDTVDVEMAARYTYIDVFVAEDSAYKFYGKTKPDTNYYKILDEM